MGPERGSGPCVQDIEGASRFSGRQLHTKDYRTGRPTVPGRPTGERERPDYRNFRELQGNSAAADRYATVARLQLCRATRCRSRDALSI